MATPTSLTLNFQTARNSTVATGTLGKTIANLDMAAADYQVQRRTRPSVSDEIWLRPKNKAEDIGAFEYTDIADIQIDGVSQSYTTLDDVEGILRGFLA